MNLKGELGVPLARLVQLVTSITLVNNTGKTQDTTTPAGKRWLILSIKAFNIDDVARNIKIVKWLEAGKTNILQQIAFHADVAQNHQLSWPINQVDVEEYTESFYTLIMDAGNTLTVTWPTGGASTGGVDADGLVIEYLEIDYP